MIALLILLLGLVLGSFVTAMSYRLIAEEPSDETRSYCPHCRHPLAVGDLIPVASWLLLKARCRYCHEPIHWRYPVIEIATAALMLATYLLFGWTAPGLLLMAAGVVMLIMLVTDLEAYLLPDACQWALLALAVIWRVTLPLPIEEALGGLALTGGMALLLHYGYPLLRGRQGLGFGDVKLLAVAGFWLGLSFVPQLLMLGGLGGALLGLLWRRMQQETPYFPFGPALLLSLWTALAMQASHQSPWLLP